MAKKEVNKQKSIMLRLENQNWIDLRILCLKSGKTIKAFVGDCIMKEIENHKKKAA